MVKEVIYFSDGSEKVINYKANDSKDEIEKMSEIETDLHRGETPLSEVMATEFAHSLSDVETTDDLEDKEDEIETL